MDDERIAILKMVSEGKITPDEAAILLDSLGDDKDGHEENDAGKDWAGQLVESIQKAFRNAPEVTENIVDSLKENLKDVREEVRHVVEDVRKEVENKKLVDFSGLSDVVARLREVRLGQSHEFEERVTGEFTDGGQNGDESDGENGDETDGKNRVEIPRMELLTQNGDITVTGWDESFFEVLIRKKVYNRDETTARKMMETAVEQRVIGTDVRIAGRFMRGVVISYEVRVPRRQTFHLTAKTHHGSIKVDRLSLGRGRISTNHGSVRLSDCRAVQLDVSTVNGKIWARGIDASECDAHSVNGIIDWKGKTLRADLSTVNGAVYYTPEISPSATHADDIDDTSQNELVASAHVKTVNGGVTLRLPAVNDELGIHLEAQVPVVQLNTDETGLVLEESDDCREFENCRITAKTRDYESARYRIELTVDCVNGRVGVLPPA